MINKINEASESTETVNNMANSQDCHPDCSERSEHLSAFKDSSFHYVSFRMIKSRLFQWFQSIPMSKSADLALSNL